MQKEIEVTSAGKVISRICFGQDLAGVAPCLDGYNDIHIVCDGNVVPYAIAVAQAIVARDAERPGSAERDGADETVLHQERCRGGAGESPVALPGEEHHCCHSGGGGCHHDEELCHGEEEEHHCCHGGEEHYDEAHHCCHGGGGGCHSGGGCHRRKLLSGRVKSITGIRATEAEKTMETVTAICGRLLEEGADRGSLVLAIGGGITTDMAGFAASIYKRGVRFAYIPTTLLAQVDAAIGGKTGVNYSGYKNMIGVIRQPEFTYVCSEVLETLPEREFLCGAAEMLKTFIIDNSSDGYAKAVRLLTDIRAILDGDSFSEEVDGHHDRPAPHEVSQEDIDSCYDRLGALVGEAASVKAGIVGRDQFESGERRRLNLGHTFAHAIEKLSGGTVAHGEAVAMGIILASRLAESTQAECQKSGENKEAECQKPSSNKEGKAGGNSLTDRLIANFKACGLPTECPYAPEALAEAMAKDKKADGGIIHFIVPRSIGQVEELDLSAEQAIDSITRL